MYTTSLKILSLLSISTLTMSTCWKYTFGICICCSANILKKKICEAKHERCDLDCPFRLVSKYITQIVCNLLFLGCPYHKLPKCVYSIISQITWPRSDQVKNTNLNRLTVRVHIGFFAELTGKTAESLYFSASQTDPTCKDRYT